MAYNYAASQVMLPGWSRAEGQTKSASVVVRPFRDLKFMNAWANQTSAIGRFFGQAIRNLSITYNKSDNFIPAPPAIDLEQHVLPNQTGSSKDIGLWITTLDNRLTLRYTHFQTEQFDARNGDVGTMAQRVLRLDGVVSSDPWNLLSQATQWTYGNGVTYASLTASQQDGIAKAIGYTGAAQVTRRCPTPTTPAPSPPPRIFSRRATNWRSTSSPHPVLDGQCLGHQHRVDQLQGRHTSVYMDWITAMLQACRSGPRSRTRVF